MTATYTRHSMNVLVEKLESDGIVHICELKQYDANTYSHSLNVAILSVSIGEVIGLNTRRLEKLALCALLHDIGKIFLPISLINKPSRLTADEFTLVKSHSDNGGLCLRRGFIRDRDIWVGVTHHHEKYNGTGYPKGLKRGKIPLFSRIIAVADVYDAVTSNRPYRTPMSSAKAIRLLMSESGKAFDPAIVKAFLEAQRRIS